MMRSRNVKGARASLIALAVVIPALYIGVALLSAMQDYRTTLGKAEIDARSTSAALNEHANRAVGEADRFLINAMGEVERSGLSATRENEPALHALLMQYTGKLPQMKTIVLIDAHGALVAEGSDRIMTQIDVRDRDYFQYHKAPGHSGLFISYPIVSRANNGQIFTLSRSLTNADGTLKMILVAGLTIDYFKDFYRSLDSSRDTRMLLVRSDGTVLVENPAPDPFVIRDLAKTPLFIHYRQSKAGSFRVEAGAADNLPHVVGFTGSADYPLLAVASVSTQSVLAPWRRRVEQSVVIGLFSVILLLSLIALLWKRLNDLLVGQADLEEKNESLALAAQVFDTSWQAIAVMSAEGTILRANKAFADISGYTMDEVIGRSFRVFENSFVDSGRYAAMLKSVRHSGTWQGEARMLTKSGAELTVRQSISMMRDGGGAVRSVVAMIQDITEQKMSEFRLHQLAHFDALTELPNRRTFADRIRLEVNRAVRRDTILAVVFIDLDHFKTINDSLGHATGDHVLQVVAARLSACVRVGDTVARIGGDEFVVLLEGNRKIESIERVATKLAAALEQAIDVVGREIYVAASMGISLFPQDGRDSETLLRNADTAMYRAKTAGRNCWRFFDESMAQHATRRLELEMTLRRAVERGELSLHYQPQHALNENRIVGVEALLRWERPGQEMVSPTEFIPVAEESGLILQIGEWVLHSACTQAEIWWRVHGLALRVAVNVAAKQIHHKDFVDVVRATLDKTGLPPELLELEITESSIIENVDDAVGKLRQLKALGITLAIDDFGTGYSSLSYLKQLPVDRLKIDKSFVRDTPDDADDCAIVRTIIAMSHNLGLSVIAEGVETERQCDFLRAQHCDEIQGYLLSMPIPAQQITPILTAREPRKRQMIAS